MNMLVYSTSTLLWPFALFCPSGYLSAYVGVCWCRCILRMILEIRSLGQRVKAFIILLRAAKFSSLEIVPFCISISNIWECLFLQRQCKFFSRYHIPLCYSSCSFSFFGSVFYVSSFSQVSSDSWTPIYTKNKGIK